MSNSRRARRAVARAGKPAKPDLRGWPIYSPAAVPLRESAGSAVLDRPTTTTVEAVSNTAWSNFSQSDYTDQQWRRACILHREPAEGQDADTKSLHSLPVREPSGALNRNGVHAAAGRINQVDASAELKRTAAKTLVGLYRNELDEDPPERLVNLAAVSESDTGHQSATITETVPVAIREAPTGSPLLVDVQLIEAGWNRAGSRYYPPDVLARDIPQVYPAGTHMYLDHPTVTEEMELPERSVTRLAAVLTSAPYTNDGGRTMRAQARVFAPHREFLTEAWRDIGVSINGDGTGQWGERDGRQGLVIEALTYGRSVDFVTKAGAGGRIVQLLESASRVREARNIGQWLESRLHLALTQMGDEMYGDGRLTREERITLSSAIGDALQAWTTRVEADAPQLFTRDLHDEPEAAAATEVREATAEETRTALSDAVRVQAPDEGFAYIEDYDPERGLVWWCQGDKTSTTTWQQGYTLDEQGEASLTGDRTEVVRRVTYEPVAQSSATEESAGPPASPDADGTPPAAPTNEGGESLMPEGTQNTGTTPAPAGTEGGLSPVARAEIAEAQLRESQARITALETTNAQLTVERDTARGELGRMRIAEAARTATTAALADTDLPEPARQRVTEAVTRTAPTTQDGQLDASALTARIGEAVAAERSYIASLREAAGEGSVTGLGGGGGAPAAVDAAKVRESLAALYKSRGLSEQAATLAANGRAY